MSIANGSSDELPTTITLLLRKEEAAGGEAKIGSRSVVGVCSVVPRQSRKARKPTEVARLGAVRSVLWLVRRVVHS